MTASPHQTIFNLQFYECLEKEKRKIINCETMFRNPSRVFKLQRSCAAMKDTKNNFICQHHPSMHILLDAVDGKLAGFGSEGVEVVRSHVAHDVPSHRRVVKVFPPVNQGNLF